MREDEHDASIVMLRAPRGGGASLMPGQEGMLTGCRSTCSAWPVTARTTWLSGELVVGTESACRSARAGAVRSVGGDRHDAGTAMGRTQADFRGDVPPSGVVQAGAACAAPVTHRTPRW